MSKTTTFTARSLASYLSRQKIDTTPDTVLAAARQLKVGSPGRFKNSPYRFTPGEANQVTAAIVRTKTAEMQLAIAKAQDKTRNLRASTLNILRDFGRLSELAQIHGHPAAAGLAKLSPVMRALDGLQVPSASMNKADFIKCETSWARLDRDASRIFDAEVAPFLDQPPQGEPEPTGPRPAAGASTRFNFIVHLKRRGSWEEMDKRVCISASGLDEASKLLPPRVAETWPDYEMKSFSFDGRS